MSLRSFDKAHRARSRTYKERHQPAARAHLGLLEKKKDYKVRARDYHSKQDRLRVLAEKAAFRNPDEFYQAMGKTQRKEGRIVKRDDVRAHETGERFSTSRPDSLSLQEAHEWVFR